MENSATISFSVRNRSFVLHNKYVMLHKTVLFLVLQQLWQDVSIFTGHQHSLLCLKIMACLNYRKGFCLSVCFSIYTETRGFVKTAILILLLTIFLETNIAMQHQNVILNGYAIILFR